MNVQASHTGIVVVGAGFSGIGIASRLRRSGIDDFVVLERQTDVGGTWFSNQYPGAGCDSPSRTYCLSFSPNPSWSHTFARQPEIHAYLRRVCDEEDLHSRIRLGCALEQATWDAEAGLWHLETSTGPRTADVLIAATGALSEPRTPEIRGADDFVGPSTHTATWPASLNTQGRRVAVIGSGASAIQLVPELQRTARQVDVYQRSAPWVLPRLDRHTHRLERALYRRWPATNRALRLLTMTSKEVFVPGFARGGPIAALGELFGRIYRRLRVPDPTLRRKLTPDYPMGCKRILLSNTYYPALAAPNVELVDDPISHLSPDGVVTRSGDFRPADVVVYATGFVTSPHPVSETIVGAGGATLAEHWAADGVSAYRGTTVAGFPNLFLLYGPNTGQGHNSIIYMLESQFTYVLGALAVIRRRPGAWVAPLPGAQRDYNARLQVALERSVWSSTNCTSWYLDANGRNTTLWPTYIHRFRQLLARFDVEHYELGCAPRAAGHRTSSDDLRPIQEHL